jgi:glycosyltransferase involved in cell wall biosynthesis
MQKRSLLYIGNKLSKKGVTVTSIETLGTFLSKEGFKVYTASSVKNKFFRMLDMVFKTMVLSRKVSVVLIDTYSTQNFYFAVAVARVCKLLKLPYIPILRGGNLPFRLEKSQRLCSSLFKEAKSIVAPSKYLMESFRNHGYTNLTYIPNTIEIENYPFQIRNEIKPKLLWVRSFAEIYNPMLALEIVKRLNDIQIKASLCMVGPEKDGSLLKCRSETTRLNLPVTFTDKLEKSEWIKLSKDYSVFINTTNFDNTPVSVIEAMALGIPIVSTNVGGMPYLIDNDKTGILVPPKNADVFEKAILRLLNDPFFTESLSISARKQAEAFDWQQVKNQWFALINE